MIHFRVKNRWQRFWLAAAGIDRWRRLATRFASWGVAPYKGRIKLAWVHQNGYIAPSAELRRRDLKLGDYVFIGNRVSINREATGGTISLGFGVELHSDCIIEVSNQGSVSIASKTWIQARCTFVSAVEPIYIGSNVQIAQSCALYSADHGFAPGAMIYEQPLQSKGPIIIEDDVWLGFNVIVLSGVRIGKGAVVGAGSVVIRDIPENAIAVGVPARVVRLRGAISS